MIQIHKLFEQQNKKKTVRLKTYNKVLHKITNRIKMTSRSNKLELVYELPRIIFGCPAYKSVICGVYLSTELKKNGFDVIYPYRQSPIHIYVSWKKYKESYVNTHIPIEHIKEREKKGKQNKFLLDKTHNKQNSSDVKRHFKNLNKKLINEYTEKNIIERVNPRMNIDHTNQEFILNLKSKYGL